MARLEIVTRRFGKLTAVDDISLGIEAGEFFTLHGSSCCGKTTILRMIAGFDLPDEGQILFDGRDLADTPPEQRPVRNVLRLAHRQAGSGKADTSFVSGRAVLQPAQSRVQVILIKPSSARRQHTRCGFALRMAFD